MTSAYAGGYNVGLTDLTALACSPTAAEGAATRCRVSREPYLADREEPTQGMEGRPVRTSGVRQQEARGAAAPGAASGRAADTPSRERTPSGGVRHTPQAVRWPRARHGAAWAIPVALAIDAVGTGLYLPPSMIYFLTVTDLSEAGVGLLLTAATACSLLLPLVVGRSVDRIGPRPVVVAGQLVQAAGFFMYLGVAGPVSLFLATLVEAVGLRVYWSSVFALIAEQADGEAKDQWFAWAGMIRAAGTGAGTVLAGVLLALASQQAYRGMVLADAISFVVAAVTVTLFVRGARRPAGGPDGESFNGIRQLLRNRPYLGLIGVNVLFNICMVFLAVAIPVYVIRGLHAPGWAVGALLTISTAVVGTCTAEVTRRARRRTSRGGAMAWGCLYVVRQSCAVGFGGVGPVYAARVTAGLRDS